MTKYEMSCIIKIFLYSSIPISFVIFVLSISHTTIAYASPNAFQYANSLPIYFWIGLLITLGSIYISLIKQIRIYLFINIIALLAYLYIAPVLIYENPYFIPSYIHASGIEIIKNNSNIEKSSISYVKDYPLSFIFGYSINSIMNVDTFVIMNYIPIILFVTSLILIYKILSDLSEKYAIIGIIATISLFWIDQIYFSPQSLAFIFYLLFWFTITQLFNYSIDKKIIVIFTITSIAVILSNPTTSYITLLIISSIIIFTIIKKYYSIAKRINTLFIFYAIAITFILSYNSYTRGIIDASNILERLTIIPTPHISFTPHISYIITNILQGSSIVYVVITGIIILYIFKRTYGIFPKEFTLWVIAFLIFSTLIIFTPFLRGTFLQRSFMFILLPWIALILLTMKYKILNNSSIIFKSILVAFIFFAVTLPITKHGHDSFNYAPTSALQGATYFSEHINASSNTISKVFFASPNTFQYVKYFGILYNNELRIVGNINEEMYNTDTYEIISNIINSDTSYIITSKSSDNLKIVRQNIYEYSDTLNKSLILEYNKIYSNSNLNIYASKEFKLLLGE